MMRDAIDIVRVAGLPATDLEREKDIAMAAATLCSARNPAVRKRALARMETQIKARSPAALTAIARAKATR